MKHSKKKNSSFYIKGILIAFVIVAIGVGCTLRIIRLNRNYPNPEVQRYTTNEPFIMDNFEVTVTEHQLLTVPEIKEQMADYDVTYVDNQGNNMDERLLLTELHLKNIGKEADVFYTYPCTLQSNAYSQGIILEYYDDFNLHLENTDGAVFLEPGEEITVYLPYIIYQISFLDSAWSKIDSREFELVFSLYPINRVVTLE